MKIKMIIVLCMAIVIGHDGFSQQDQRKSVIRVQDNSRRPVKKVTTRVYERSAPYPYYSYPYYSPYPWGPYPWAYGLGYGPGYGPGYYGPGFGISVGF